MPRSHRRRCEGRRRVRAHLADKARGAVDEERVEAVVVVRDLAGHVQLLGVLVPAHTHERWGWEQTLESAGGAGWVPARKAWRAGAGGAPGPSAARTRTAEAHLPDSTLRKELLPLLGGPSSSVRRACVTHRGPPPSSAPVRPLRGCRCKLARRTPACPASRCQRRWRHGVGSRRRALQARSVLLGLPGAQREGRETGLTGSRTPLMSCRMVCLTVGGLMHTKPCRASAMAPGPARCTSAQATHPSR